MEDSQKLLNLKEVSQLLKVNTEVLRRWLRSGRLHGVKVGSDWRVFEEDLNVFLRTNKKSKNGQNKDVKSLSSPGDRSMCFHSPKWLEFSGLPTMFNDSYGPETWPIFKKLVELDFDAGKPRDRKVGLDMTEVAENLGYDVEIVSGIIRELAKSGYITISDTKKGCFFSIVTPIRTPRLILDINYENGGVRGAPQSALENACLRRFLES